MVNVSSLIGLPFEYGGRGPDKFDCFGLLMHILKENHGQDIPDFRSTSDRAVIQSSFATGLPMWEKTEQGANTPVLFRVGKYVSHCGYMIDSMRMVHTWEKSGGVVIERVDVWKQRIVGFYKYVGRPE